MGATSILENIIEEKLLNINTAFFGKVVSVDSPDLCSVQPLDKIKAYGKTAQSQPLLIGVPVLNHVRHYTLEKVDGHPSSDNVGHLKVEPLKSGDIVLCVCGQRDIASSSKGASTTPPIGHHQAKDAVVVGLIGRWSHE